MFELLLALFMALATPTQQPHHNPTTSRGTVQAQDDDGGDGGDDGNDGNTGHQTLPPPPPPPHQS